MAWGPGHSNIQRLGDKTESTSETEEEWSVSMERHQGRFESWKGNSSKQIGKQARKVNRGLNRKLWMEVQTFS